MNCTKLPKEFAGSIVCKTKVAADDFLIEHGSAEKTPHLLFFYGIARRGKNVTTAGKDRAGNLPVERGEKGDVSFFKGDNSFAAPKLDVIGGNDVVDIGGINAQRFEGLVEFVGRSLRGGKSRRRKKTAQ